jgi:hypothetical protein
MEKYNTYEQLGDGTYGTVHKGVNSSTSIFKINI